MIEETIETLDDLFGNSPELPESEPIHPMVQAFMDAPEKPCLLDEMAGHLNACRDVIAVESGRPTVGRADMCAILMSRSGAFRRLVPYNDMIEFDKLVGRFLSIFQQALASSPESQRASTAIRNTRSD